MLNLTCVTCEIFNSGVGFILQKTSQILTSAFVCKNFMNYCLNISKKHVEFNIVFQLSSYLTLKWENIFDFFIKNSQYKNAL